jgi:hypothetical protein
MTPAGLNPYAAQALSDFAGVMVQEWGRGVLPPSGGRSVRAPGYGIDYLDADDGPTPAGGPGRVSIELRSLELVTAEQAVSMPLSMHQLHPSVKGG